MRGYQSNRPSFEIHVNADEEVLSNEFWFSDGTPDLGPYKNMVIKIIELLRKNRRGLPEKIQRRLYVGGPRFTRIGRAIRYAKSDLDAFTTANTARSTLEKVGS
jgi:hypothetical protein